jgi:glycerol-3-phosphate cytidylyltransferase
MRKVLTYGTFDLFHIGHLNILRRARDLGDHLVVGVSTDAFNARKHKSSTYPFEHRREIVRAIRWVDEVIAEESWDQKERDIREHGISVFVMGDDWTGEFDHLRALCEVVYLPRTPDVSTTGIKNGIAGSGGTG